MFVPNLEKFFEDFEEFVSQLPEAAAKVRVSMTKDDIDSFFTFRTEPEEKETPSLNAALKAMIYLESDREKFDSLKESMNIYQVLAFYLIQIYPYCSEKFFREYVLLCVMILKALNEKGDMFIEKGEKRKASLKNEEGKKQFADGNFIHIASEILNLFIAELFPNLLKRFKALDVNFEFLGFEDDHIKNLILMTKFLANWMFNNELTDYRLEINVDL